jgi:hypothetical protein
MEVREEGAHHQKEGQFCYQQVHLVSTSQERWSVAWHVLQDAARLQRQDMDGSW